jgi:hypothetical protein
MLRHVPGLGGIIRKVEFANDLINPKLAPPPAPSVPRGTLPPEAPEIVRQGWAMQRGGQPAPPAETGEALATVRQNAAASPRAVQGTTPTVQQNSSPAQMFNNASSDSAASYEAQQVAKSEAAQGVRKVLVDTRSGIERPAIGPRPEDNPLNPYEQLEYRGGNRDGEVIASGDKARAYTRKPQAPEPVSIPLGKPSATPSGNPLEGLKMKQASSGPIQQYSYDPATQRMVVHFRTNGNVYEYKGVPQEVFDRFQQSESHGSHHSQNIKGRYETNLIGNVPPNATPGMRVRQALGGKPSSGL